MPAPSPPVWTEAAVPNGSGVDGEYRRRVILRTHKDMLYPLSTSLPLSLLFTTSLPSFSFPSHPFPTVASSSSPSPLISSPLSPPLPRTSVAAWHRARAHAGSGWRGGWVHIFVLFCDMSITAYPDRNRRWWCFWLGGDGPVCGRDFKIRVQKRTVVLCNFYQNSRKSIYFSLWVQSCWFPALDCLELSHKTFILSFTLLELYQQ